MWTVRESPLLLERRWAAIVVIVVVETTTTTIILRWPSTPVMKRWWSTMMTRWSLTIEMRVVMVLVHIHRLNISVVNRSGRRSRLLVLELIALSTLVILVRCFVLRKTRRWDVRYISRQERENVRFGICGKGICPEVFVFQCVCS